MTQTAPAPCRPPTTEVRALTGLRGIAALDVVLGHYDIHGNPWLHPFIFHDAAVDVFFALSSFTLCLVYGAGDAGRLNLRAFAAARFARVYPLYAATTLAGLILVLHARVETARQTMHRLASQLLLIDAWPIPAVSGSWNAPSWSLSVEALCYAAVFPLLFRWSGRRWGPRRLVVLLAAAAASAFMAYRWHYNPAVNGFPAAPVADRWAYWVAMIRGGTMFVAGWAAYLLWRQHAAFREAIGWATDGLALMFVLIVVGERFNLLTKEAVVLVAPLLIAGLMDRGSVTARLLSSPPVHFLGVISYSIYLLHLEVYQVLTGEWRGLARHEVLRIGVPLAATLVAASASYFLFESPARRWLRRWLDAAPARRVAPAI